VDSAEDNGRTRPYLEEHAVEFLTRPLVGNFAISWAAAVHVTDLKDPPSPASDFFETRKEISRSSSSGVHWHFSTVFLAPAGPVAGLAGFRPRLAGGSGWGSLPGLFEELRVIIMMTQVRLVAIVAITSHSHVTCRLLGNVEKYLGNFGFWVANHPLTSLTDISSFSGTFLGAAFFFGFNFF
jgi:hypothetical protein